MEIEAEGRGYSGTYLSQDPWQRVGGLKSWVHHTHTNKCDPRHPGTRAPRHQGTKNKGTASRGNQIMHIRNKQISGKFHSTDALSKLH